MTNLFGANSLGGQAPSGPQSRYILPQFTEQTSYGVKTSDPYNKDQAGIIATPESGIKTVADLAGKRIAVNPAGKGEYITLKALTQAGSNCVPAFSRR